MRHLTSALLFGLSLVLALAACDAYLQCADIQTPMETRIDPRLGPTYIPGKRISRFNEGFYLGEANDYGYMGPSVPPRRTGEERRVLLLGDSFVLGHTVLPRHHFARRLETLLADSSGEKASVLNFGKADFNISNMYAYLADFAGTFDHDLALFFVGEDDLLPARQIATGLYPVVKLDGGSLVVDTSFHSSRTYGFYRAVEPIFTRSAVLRLAFNADKMVKRGELADVLLDKFAPTFSPAPDATPANDSEPTPAPAISPVTLAVLRTLARDPRNVLVTKEALAAPLRAELKRIGVPVLDLGAALAELEASGEDLTYWPVTRVHGHWNHAAHQRIAQFLAGALPENGLLWPTVPDATSPRSTH